MSKNTKLTSTDPRVISFYNDISSRKRDKNGHLVGSAKSESGYLYVTSDNRNSVLVCLPLNLIEYANAASGTMSGRRPVGIRSGNFSSPIKAANAVNEIFSSPEKLAKFLNDSECDAVYHPDQNDTTIWISKLVDERMIKDAFYDVGYNWELLQQLRTTYGAETVKRDWDNLRVTEFQLRYAV